MELDAYSKAHIVAHPEQTRLQKSGFSRPTFTKFVTKVGREGVIGGVKARILAAIVPSIMKCQHRE